MGQLLELRLELRQALGHSRLYSRHHKSKFFCDTCHDVSNPALANLNYKQARPGDRVVLPSEVLPASGYYHVERTYSEFRLSAYDRPGGAEGLGPFSPNAPANYIDDPGWLAGAIAGSQDRSLTVAVLCTRP